MFNVQAGGNSLSGIVNLVVGGVELTNVMVDSGAVTNIVSATTWKVLKVKQVSVRAEKKTTRKLYAYGSDTPLRTSGTFTPDVCSPVNGKKCEVDFVGVEGDGRSLLEKTTVEVLDLLRVGPAPRYAGQDGDIRHRYPQLFDGIGKLKGRELKLHIDETATPVAQRQRRIPFNLRPAVDKKIDELLDADIIEAVPDSPSTWVSPLVVVPKRDGDVRVCVDSGGLRCAPHTLGGVCQNSTKRQNESYFSTVLDKIP